MGFLGAWGQRSLHLLGARGSDRQGDPSPNFTAPLDRGVLPRPPSPWDPHSPPVCPYLPHSGPADRPVVACGHCGLLVWLVPAAAPPGGGHGGNGSWEVVPHLPPPCSSPEQEPPFSFLLLGTPWPTAWGMTQSGPPTGISAQPSANSLHRPALPPMAGPGMYLLQVLTQELGSLRGAVGGESFC